VGHVVIGDNGHTDSRWRDPEFWDRMKTIAERTAPEGCDLSHLADHNQRLKIRRYRAAAAASQRS
jgi:hypothetical protein